MADLTTVVRIHGTCIYRDDIADRANLAGYTRLMLSGEVGWEVVLRDAYGDRQHSTHDTRDAADDALLAALEVGDA